MKGNNDDWHRREIERLDKLLHAEKELKRMLAKMIDNHKKWLRQHDVRLTEHWRHISRIK